MAYNFIPKSITEIVNARLSSQAEVLALYSFIVDKVSAVSDPIALDKNKPKDVKVMRAIQSKIDMKELTRVAPNLKIAWGNGSRGNAGAGNRGNLFERELADDIQLYIDEGITANFDNAQFMKELVAYYKLENAKTLSVKTVGELNQKRPLVFQGDQPYILGSNFDIGSTVTDVTLTADNKEIYLSLKLGGTVTFFNAGVKRIFPDNEMKSGFVSDASGQRLLDLFGIDNSRFCEVFNMYGKAGTRRNIIEEDTFNRVDKTKMKNFIKSGIGFNYHLVHKMGNNIHHFEIKRQDLDRFSTPQSCRVRYPIGEAKRIDMFVETPMFSLKFNIRNKQGGLYPSHIMSDYKIKH